MNVKEKEDRFKTKLLECNSLVKIKLTVLSNERFAFKERGNKCFV
jgi:hypothetical protein